MAEEATGMGVLLKKLEEMRSEIEANTAKMNAKMDANSTELREEMKAMKQDKNVARDETDVARESQTGSQENRSAASDSQARTVDARASGETAGGQVTPARGGTYHAAPRVPKFKGGTDSYPTWKQKMAAYLSSIGGRKAVERKGEPVMIGDENKTEEELIAIHGTTLHDEARIAWLALLDAMEDDSLSQIIIRAGSPSLAWGRLEEYFRPRTRAEKQRLLHDYENAEMILGENPFDYMSRVEEIVQKLGRLGIHKEKANERAQVEVARKEAAAARDSLAAKEAARCAASDSQAREEETAKMAKERAQAEAVRNEAAAAGDSLAAKEATRSAASNAQAREDDDAKMAVERAKNVVARDETEGARYSQTGSQDAWSAASDSQAVNEEHVMEEGRETVGEATSGDETTDETWGQMTPPLWSASGEEAFPPEESSNSRSKVSSMVADEDGRSWGAEQGDTKDGAPRTHPFDRGKMDSWIAVSKSLCSPQARVS